MKASRLVLVALLAACDSPAPAAGTAVSAVQAQDSLKEDFEKDNPRWNFAAGTWTRKNGVLIQSAETQPWAVALLEDKKFSDVDVSVRWKPVSGKEDQTGGIVFRAKDAKSYYLVRANGLEDNCRLYTMTEGARKQLASAKVDAPKAGEWHTLRVVAKGSKIQAFLNGKILIDHESTAFTSGYVGLWTKADSVTEFDDFEAAGVAVP